MATWGQLVYLFVRKYEVRRGQSGGVIGSSILRGTYLSEIGKVYRYRVVGSDVISLDCNHLNQLISNPTSCMYCGHK